MVATTAAPVVIDVTVVVVWTSSLVFSNSQGSKSEYSDESHSKLKIDV
jgi:hypothetical protein